MARARRASGPTYPALPHPTQLLGSSGGRLALKGACPALVSATDLGLGLPTPPCGGEIQGSWFCVYLIPLRWLQPVCLAPTDEEFLPSASPTLFCP